MKQLPDGLLADIEQRLVAALHPEKIILFGSYAYGEPNKDSDIDLLVIVPRSEEPSHRRAQMAHSALSDIKIPTDVLVMTREEVSRKATVPSSLVTLVLRKGKVLMAEGQNSDDTQDIGDEQYAEDAQREEVKQWLVKSQRDLKVSQLLLSNETYLLDSAAYHCQQAAEKALKGYLAHQKLEAIKTHNLKVLIDLCIPFEASFKSIKESADTLTPYATESRYPGNDSDPERAEVEAAVKTAERIVSFVIELLPDGITD